MAAYTAFLGVLVCSVLWLVHAQMVCPSIPGRPSCVCRHPDGVIDLTPLANTNGTPRFTGLQDPNDWLYSFNPCYTYSEQLCQNVYICQSRPNETTQYYNIATGGEQIRTNSDGKVYLYYTGDAGRTVNVFLHCNYNMTGKPRVTATGSSTGVLYYYVFDVYSCHVCPGGCKRPSVPLIPIMNCTLPNSSQSGSVQNPSLQLTVEVAVLIGVIPSVIALFLLIVIIILVYKLHKRSQYHQLKQIAFSDEEET